MEYWLEVVG